MMSLVPPTQPLPYMAMRWLWLLAAALVGCGGAPVKKKKPTGDGADPAKAQLLVNEAKNELESEHFQQARKLLDEANRFSDVKVRHHIELTNQAIDKGEARKVGEQANALAKQGRCSEAVEATAKVAGARPDTEVPKRLRAHTNKALAACIRGLLDKDELAAAQRVIASPAARSAFTAKKRAAVAKEVHQAVINKLQDRIAPTMAEREWAKATEVLLNTVKAGEAKPSERDELLTEVRAGIAADVDALVAANFGAKKGAEEALVTVDALLKAGFYLPAQHASEEEEKKTDGTDARVAKLFRKDGPTKTPPKATGPNVPTEHVPAKLNDLRNELAMWVTCQRLHCHSQPTKQGWLYGHANLRPTYEPAGEPLRQLRHGRSVWRIAEAGDNVLISRKDPGQLADLRARSHVAWGWLPKSALRWENTAEWLPPGSAIIGARVWGPLRKGSKTYELGTVVGADGNEVQVQRLADRDIVIAARSSLHFGVVKKGIKVMAFCEATKLQPAVVASVKLVKHATQGESRAKVNCVDAAGKTSGTQDANFGALRMKPEWLPRRR